MEARTGQVTSTSPAALHLLDALLATVSSPTASPISSDPAVWRPTRDHQQGHPLVLPSGEDRRHRRRSAQDGLGTVTFAPTMVGDIAAREMRGESLFVQSGSFLASSPTIELDTKWGGARTFFSSEGLFVLKATGVGVLFMSSYGAIHAVTLAPGEQLVMDTGHMVAFDATMGYHVRTVGGLKQTLFSGEGLVVDLTGPGTIYMQTRNFGAFVNYLVPKLPFKREELAQDGDLRAIVAERAALVQSNMAATAPEVIVVE